MSKVKSILGEVVDFEMMRIMEEFGTVNVSTQPSLKPATVDPAALVVDPVLTHTGVMGRPEFVSTPTVAVTEPLIAVSAPQITIEQPETVDKTAKVAKKGEK